MRRISEACFLLAAVLSTLEGRLHGSDIKQPERPWTLPGEVFGSRVTGALELEGVSTILKMDEEDGRWVKLSCGSIQAGNQSFLGLRIAWLPRLDISGMEWRVFGEGWSSDWCGKVWDFFHRESALRNARIHGFILSFESHPGFQVASDFAEFRDNGGVLELRGASLRAGSGGLHFPRASLFLDGERAGEIEIFDESGKSVSFELPFSELPRMFLPNQKPMNLESLR